MAELGFGMMRLPGASDGRVDVDTVRRMADLFLGSGLGYFDTAYYYHDGGSETAFRDAVAGRHPRGSFRLADKLPMKLISGETDPSVQGRLLAEQLERCGVERFDRYLLHNVCRTFLPAAERLGSFGFLGDVKDTGVADRIGVSVHDDAGYVAGILDAHDSLDFVQLQVNYLDWESPVVQSRRCYEEAVSRGVPVTVMEPLRGGALADPPEEARRILERSDPGTTPASWALRFVAGLDGVDVVLSGMSDLSQMASNIRTFRDLRPLDGEESETLERAARVISSSVAVPCTGCGYCDGACPVGIPIPSVLAAYNDAVSAPSGGRPPQRFYYRNSSVGRGLASDCLRCGMCETECPQHIPIREWLERAAGLLERLRGSDSLNT